MGVDLCHAGLGMSSLILLKRHPEYALMELREKKQMLTRWQRFNPSFQQVNVVKLGKLSLTRLLLAVVDWSHMFHNGICSSW